jgi:Flp pilus assembly pilin Flp
MVGEMMKQHLRDFCADETAAAAIEYALLTSMIAMAIIGAASILGGGFFYGGGLWWMFYRLGLWFDTGLWYDTNGQNHGY